MPELDVTVIAPRWSNTHRSSCLFSPATVVYLADAGEVLAAEVLVMEMEIECNFCVLMIRVAEVAAEVAVEELNLLI